MKITKKVIVLLVAVMMVIGCSIGGTVAWLATKTESVVNTFTVGNINIKLEEPHYVPVDGKSKILPGDEIPKDPTVTVLANSEPCYVRMYMIVNWSAKADGQFQGTEAEAWFDIDKGVWVPAMSKVDNDSTQHLVNIYEFRYKEIVDARTSEKTLTPLFNNVTVPDALTGLKYASLADSQVIVLAQAVQAEGFNGNAAAAFEAAGHPEYVADMIEFFNGGGYTNSLDFPEFKTGN